MNFQIGLAERIIEIQALYDKVYSQCRKFRIPEHLRESPDIVITITRQEIEQEQCRMVQDEGETPDRAATDPASAECVLVCKKISDAMLSFDTFLMHGVCVAAEGRGYIITAPSGVGKSSRAFLWLESMPDARIINGDKPLIRIAENAAYAYGTPWAGKERLTLNQSVPVQAIFLLERSRKKDELVIEEINVWKALPLLVRQTYVGEESAFTQKVIRLLYSMKNTVRFFRFRSEQTVEAVRLAYEAARPRNDSVDS